MKHPEPAERPVIPELSSTTPASMADAEPVVAPLPPAEAPSAPAPATESPHAPVPAPAVPRGRLHSPSPRRRPRFGPIGIHVRLHTLDSPSLSKLPALLVHDLLPSRGHVGSRNCRGLAGLRPNPVAAGHEPCPRSWRPPLPNAGSLCRGPCGRSRPP